MQNFILALMFVACLATPAFAGEGATKWYGYFFDNGGATSVNFVCNTWLSAINRNSYPATFKIKYYKYDGTVISTCDGINEFEHTVQPNSTFDLNVRSDLFPASGQQPPCLPYNDVYPQAGSYVIKVTDGSIILRSFIQRKMGDSNSDTAYTYLDQLSLIEMPPHTITSTRLNMESFNLNFPTGTLNGFWDIHLHITNPDDENDAIVKMTFYDSTIGQAVDLIQHDIDSTTAYTFTLVPHQNKPIHPEEYISFTGLKKYNVVFEVIKGSVTGNYITFNYVVNSNGITTYKTDGGAITKQLIIK